MRAMAVTAAGQPLEAIELPDPHAGDGQVVVEVRACGVCFTDVKVAAGLAGHLPLVPGHEPVGVIAEVGPGIRDLRVGDRVGIHAILACEECAACRAGRQQACIRGVGALVGIGQHGGYAPYLAVPAANVVRLPGEIGFAEAAPLLCAGLTSFAGLLAGRVQPGDRVAVIGIGGLGHLAIPIAAALGAEVYAVTGSPGKVTYATGKGAVFAGDAASVADALASVGGAHVVLNTSDAFDGVAALLPALAIGARVVLAAGSGTSLGVSPGDLLGRQLSVTGTFFGSRQDVRDLVALAVSHEIRPEVERYPPGQVNAVHDRLRANAVRYRAVVDHALS
jgi:D-arabinose 1-dehydrogenase-like Zn-dependent alcohol dehydrogenase